MQAAAETRPVFPLCHPSCRPLSPAAILSLPQVGKKNRSTGATLMNQDSSRSHSIFTVVVETLAKGGAGGSGGDPRSSGSGSGRPGSGRPGSSSPTKAQGSSGGSSGAGEGIRVGKLNLVDLAGRCVWRGGAGGCCWMCNLWP